VGECTNLMPFDYVYSVGHTLRIGTSGEYRRSPLIIVGFVLFSIAEYSVFAPFYLFQFLKKLPGTRGPAADNTPSVGNAGE